MKKKKRQTTTNMAPAAQRNYKDTLFRMIFKDPEALLSLYNAVNDTEYTDPRDL